ncbi:hypothetical protein CNR22_12550 [Sphingobacteriaceae bacterium]|nr:hypothetical protein CNR22_12550 [Sphingobacteriaceae bacterium]
MHKTLAHSLGVISKPVDDDLRWQDQGFGALKNLYAWIKNALNYKKYSGFEFILVDGLHFSPIIARKLGVLPKHLKIISHMGNQLPYFMLAKQIPFYSRIMHKWLLNNYDAIFCEGEMIREIIQTLRPDIKTKLLCTFLGPSTGRVHSLRAIEPEFKGFNLISIASGPSAARIYYKGLDIMVEAFLQAKKTLPGLKYYIVGDWSEEDIKSLTRKFNPEDLKTIFFLGHQSDIDSYIKNSDLNIHVARGDAFPTSTIEAMHAGLPIIVSNYTGTKQILKGVNPDLIINLSSEDLAKKIIWFFGLSLLEKQEISVKEKQAAEKFTEVNAIEHYRKTFDELVK